MAIEKVNNTTYSKGIAENYRNYVKESDNLGQKKTKPMMEMKKEEVVVMDLSIEEASKYLFSLASINPQKNA